MSASRPLFRRPLFRLAALICVSLARNGSAAPDPAAADAPTTATPTSTTTTTSPHGVSVVTSSPATTAALAQPRPRVTTIPLHLSQLEEAPHTLAEVRKEARERYQTLIAEASTTSPSPENEELWEDALYVTTLLPPDNLAREVVRKALAAYGALPEELQRLSLEAAYGLDPQAFLAEAASVAELTTSSKHFAMASLYLCRGLPEPAGARQGALARLARKFPAWTSDPILTMLHFDLCRGAGVTDGPPGASDGATTPTGSAAALVARSRPPLSELLSKQFAPGWPVVYSLQRPDRSWPGLALVRRPDGRFHRNPDGTFFRISHLARSRTSLPGYITNGNTPQGIFSVGRLGESRLAAIGKTPNLRLYLPHETTPDRWFHDPSLEGSSWTLEMYRGLLPGEDGAGGPSPGTGWRDYFPIYTAWHAGAAGRYDILAHGTTVDPALYTGRSWYPNTPTSGCICAKELWDEGTGQALVSDQLALVHAWLEAAGIAVPRGQGEETLTLEGRGPTGFLVVVELDDKPQPVTLDEVLTEVLDAERR